MSHKTLRTMALALALLISAVIAAPELLAQHGKMRQCPGYEKGYYRGPWYGNLEVMQEKLGLSDGQVEKITAINANFRKQMLDHREKLAPKNIQLRKLLLEDNVNISNVRANLREIYDIKIEIRITMIEHRLAIENVLTEKQKNRLRIERKKMRRGHYRGHGGYDTRPMARPAGYQEY